MLGDAFLCPMSAMSSARSESGNSRVHGHDHSELAVGSLSTVEVHWGGVRHFDAVGRQRLRVGSDGVETAVDALVLSYRLARRLKGRLRDGVVAWVELELDGVSGGGADISGLEDKGLGVFGRAYGNNMCC